MAVHPAHRLSDAAKAPNAADRVLLRHPLRVEDPGLVLQDEPLHFVLVQAEDLGWVWLMKYIRTKFHFLSEAFRPSGMRDRAHVIFWLSGGL